MPIKGIMLLRMLGEAWHRLCLWIGGWVTALTKANQIQESSATVAFLVSVLGDNKVPISIVAHEFETVEDLKERMLHWFLNSDSARSLRQGATQVKYALPVLHVCLYCNGQKLDRDCDSLQSLLDWYPRARIQSETEILVDARFSWNPASPALRYRRRVLSAASCPFQQERMFMQRCSNSGAG